MTTATKAKTKRSPRGTRKCVRKLNLSLDKNADVRLRVLAYAHAKNQSDLIADALEYYSARSGTEKIVAAMTAPHAQSTAG